MRKKAVLIAFTLKSSKLSSSYEKVKFFKALYGWKQVVSSKKSRYEYERPGLLKGIPHVKVDQSSFLVQEEDLEKIVSFFEEWADKVIWKSFKVLLEEDLEEMLDEYG
jgi:methionine aminopeptidase